MAAPEKHYARPPITEAVLELRFGENSNERDIERLREKFKSKYANIEEMQNIEVSIEPGGKVSQKITASGLKMTDKNAVDVLMVGLVTLGTIRLAPYESWTRLLDQAKENFEQYVKILGRRPVTRIGTRFLNRIDIPNAMLEGRKLTDFFNIGVSLNPRIARVIGEFNVAVNAIHEETGAKLIVQSGMMPPALLEHVSISLDTDAYWDTDIPQRIDEMWTKVDILRIAKNSVFENSITDKLRALFQ